MVAGFASLSLFVGPATARAEDTQSPRENQSRAIVDVELQHAFLTLYDQRLQTTGARLGFGVQGQYVEGLVMADFGIGTLGTANLHASGASLGFELLGRPASFIRLGGGTRLGYLNVSRVTSSSPMESFSLGGYLGMKVDVYDFGARDDHGAFVGARLDIDMYSGNGEQGPLVWGPELLAGFRY